MLKKSKIASLILSILLGWAGSACALSVPGIGDVTGLLGTVASQFNGVVTTVVGAVNDLANASKDVTNAIKNTATCIANSVVKGGQCAVSAVRDCPNQTPWGIAYKLNVQKQDIKDVSESAVKGYVACTKDLCCMNNEFGFEPGYNEFDAICSAFNTVVSNGDERQALAAMAKHMGNVMTDPLKIENIKNFAQDIGGQVLHHCTPGL